MSDPLISVCIANYNGMDVIGECIESVLNQTGDFQIEILVHDDASTDESVAHIADHYPQVRLIPSLNNVGFCISNNRMVAAAQGQYILLLNNDAVLYTDALAALHAGALAQGSPCILTLPQYDYQSGALVDRGCFLDPFYNPVPNDDPNREEVAMVIGACLWIDKSLWTQFDGFPAWFGSIAEDMFLCCQARWSGYVVKALASSGYRHRQGLTFSGARVTDTRAHSTFLRRSLSERNKTYVMLIQTPLAILVWLLPLHIVFLMFEGLLLSLATLNPAYMRLIYVPAVSAIWKKRHEILRSRQSVLRGRKIGVRSYLKPFKITLRKAVLLLRYGIPRLR